MAPSALPAIAEDMKNNLLTSGKLALIKRQLVAMAIIIAAVALGACSDGSKKHFVVGVSQCSEDTWREKLNKELSIAALYYNDIDLRISSANDDVQLQTQQINNFVKEHVDLLIVAPGQVTISPAIDHAFEQGIPVIVFDRRTHSDKYTAYIGADNKEIGRMVGGYLAGRLKNGGRIVELCGLPTSSPAIERSEGFDSIVMQKPNISIVAKVHADWTEQGAFRVMDSLLTAGERGFDYVFAHNDRMAMGARRAAEKHHLDLDNIKFIGIDAMPQKGGGMQLVRDGKLLASYIYPTRGDEVMRLAMNILEDKHYERENRLSSALVTQDNASVLLMQYGETEKQQDHLSTLRSRIDKATSDFNTQRTYLMMMLVVLILLITVCALAVNAYRTKARINQKLKKSINLQQQMTRDMEQMTQTQLQFFTNVSHELRTPLTLIAGPTEQLLADNSMGYEQRKKLEMVMRNTKILVQQVNEILDFRKVQNNKAELKLNRFDLPCEINNWANDFKTVAEQRHININVCVEGNNNDWQPIIADRDKLEHVFFNLMSNALKYTPDGGSITIGAALQQEQCHISISDTGKGIDKADMEKLFERFYQAKGAIGGTGIGLSLVKAYIDMHHGKVEVQSQPGKGTTFTITLPCSQPGYDAANDTGLQTNNEHELIDDYVATDINAEHQVERITNAEEFDNDRPLVLIVDDNNGMRSYLKSILKDKYNVVEAADGQSALALARRVVPKLVVCDVMMPVMDGMEFTKRMKTDTATSHIPIILLTARSLNEQREEAYTYGADSYITKPFSASVLLARIDNLLQGRIMLRSLFGNSIAEVEAEEQLGATDKDFVTRLRDIIKQNMADSELSVERIGEEIGLSRVQLYRKVKALTGQSPVELIRKARLAKARRMIETTDMSVSEIAYSVGFSSPSYFNKCFKDEFGANPSKFVK